MSTWRNSPLPKEVYVNMSAIPVFTSAGDSAMQLTSKDTDVETLSLINTTSTSIPVTVTDGNNIQIANLSAWPVDPNTPYNIQFNVPERCVSGVKIYAASTGLKVTMHGWRQTAFTTNNA